MITTRWHKLRQAVLDGRLAVAESPTLARGYDEVPEFNRKLYAGLVEGMDEFPRFIVEPDLIPMLLKSDSVKSILDMNDCGLLSLPFHECVVEYDNQDFRYFVTFMENVDREPDDPYSWLAFVSAAYTDEGEDTAVAYPFGVSLGIDAAEARFRAAAFPLSYWEKPLADRTEEDDDNFWKFVRKTEDSGLFEQMFQRAAVGFIALAILSNTLGVTKERVENKKLNAARKKRGKPPIPDHTVIRLSHYETQSGETKRYDERAPVQVHLRRAHKRRVAYGQGRTERRWQLFPAQVVGYLPDGTKPSMIEIMATRATKPYVVKK